MSLTRRHTREELASTLRYQSEERFRLLVESAKDYAIFMLDTEGAVASWNAGAQRITGYTASEAIGTHISQFYTEEARETHRPDHELTLAARDGRTEDEDWRVGKGGERFWSHTVITALHDAQGALRGYASTFRDLSDRRRQEEQLANNEERLRALLANVRDYAIIMLDPSGIVVSWSEGAERIEGYRAEEIIGAHFSRFLPPEAVQRGWPEHELRVAAIEGRFEDENWRVRKDGSRYWANVVITALRDRNSRFIGFCKITRDLTERRHQEEALRESQERFRLLIESVQEYAIYMLDAAGHVMSWNAGAQTILGFSAAEIVGKHFSRFYPPDEINGGQPWQQLEAARDRGRLESEGLRVRKDGTAFNAHVLIAAVHDSEGKLQGFSHITHDLTRLRHMRALEDSGRRMSEFLAVLSHELRNPLAPVRHAVALLQRGSATVETQRSLTTIIDHQITHLTRVIDDLLDVSRIVRGHIAIEREAVKVSTLVARALEIATPSIQLRRHTLHVAPCDEGWAVEGDLIRLAQVLANLLDNAAKFTPEGGQIWLGVRRAQAEVRISVQDSGCGIAPDLLAHLFDFFAPPEHIGLPDRGLGVGLGLVRRLVELHCGRVEARSEGPGHGAQFVVTLPLMGIATAATAVSQRRDSRLVADARADNAPHRILVVDDNVDSAMSLTLLLQAMGFEAESAHDGIEALEAVERFEPDAVLLDIGLPRLNGYEVARRLRANGERHLLVALTGWGQEEDRARARDAGFDHHLVKPVDLEQLSRILQSPGPPH